MKEENPFENRKVAKEWIKSVESEKGMVRDKEVYPLIQRWINKIKPKNIVEIGSGQGICSNKVKFKRISYLGVEPSKYLVNRANRLYKGKNKQFTVDNVYNLSLEEASFDAVFSLNVWFHLKNLKKASSELSRILKKNGQFLIITANPKIYKIWESFYIKPKKIGKKISGQMRIFPNNVLEKNIMYKHTLTEIKKSLKLSNLHVSKISELGKTENGKKLFIAIFGKKL